MTSEVARKAGPKPRAAGAVAPTGLAAEERRRFYTALQRLLRIYQFRDRDIACYGDVSPDECYALEAIEAEGPLRVGDLAAALNLHKSNASRLASTLEAKGYVARAGERGDGRAVRLRIAARGRVVHDAIQARVEAIHAEILARYPAATRHAFVLLLGELADEARERVGGGGRGGCAPESGRVPESGHAPKSGCAPKSGSARKGSATDRRPGRWG